MDASTVHVLNVFLVHHDAIEDPLVKGMRIDVDTRNGVVYLTGRVSSEAEKNKAIDLARQSKGVRDVEANLTITSRS